MNIIEQLGRPITVAELPDCWAHLASDYAALITIGNHWDDDGSAVGSLLVAFPYPFGTEVYAFEVYPENLLESHPNPIELGMGADAWDATVYPFENGIVAFDSRDAARVYQYPYSYVRYRKLDGWLE